jgi:hypothetical protein
MNGRVPGVLTSSTVSEMIRGRVEVVVVVNGGTSSFFGVGGVIGAGAAVGAGTGTGDGVGFGVTIGCCCNWIGVEGLTGAEFATGVD